MVERPEEGAQLLQHERVDGRVRPALAVGEAALLVRRPQAVEAAAAVVVEVVGRQAVLDAQERLHLQSTRAIISVETAPFLLLGEGERE